MLLPKGSSWPSGGPNSSTGFLGESQITLLLIQLPDKASGEAIEGGCSAWAAATQVGHLLPQFLLLGLGA